MTVREIIESGIIELYVMNALPADEAAQVAAWATEFPEVRAEIEASQNALESYAQAFAVAPRPELKEEILSKFEAEKGGKIEENPVNNREKDPLSNLGKNGSSSNIWAWAIGLLGLVGASFLFYKNQIVQNELKECATENDRLVAQQRKDVADLQQKINILRSPDTKTIQMNGLQISTESRVLVYWNAKEQATLLSIVKLPAPISGKQYQLWAIVNGKPVDAGVFAYNLDSIQQMKIFDRAEAFAVTLENEGGSPTPTLDKMYVMGTP